MGLLGLYQDVLTPNEFVPEGVQLFWSTDQRLLLRRLVEAETSSDTQNKIYSSKKSQTSVPHIQSKLHGIYPMLW